MRERLPNLAREAEPPSASRKLSREAAAAFFGTLALAAAAKWQVPFYPVPMTLQTFVVLILGAFFGARLASATVGLYLAAGFVGLPVFAGWAAGPETLAGPTGGYLFGFLAAAALVGLLAERGVMRSLFGLIVAMCLGHVVISAFGFGWLAAEIGPSKAWAIGVAPFYLAMLLKTTLAVALTYALAPRLGGQDPER